MICVPVPHESVASLAIVHSQIQGRQIGSETHQDGRGTGGHWTATILDKLIGVLAKKPCDDAQGWVH
jgi:hypothetical protein